MPNTFPQSKACLYNQTNVGDYFSLQTGCELISVPPCVYFDSKASRDFLSQLDYLPNNTSSLLLSGRLSDWLQQIVADCVQPIACNRFLRRFNAKTGHFKTTGW